MCGVMFITEGIQKFMGMGMNINNQDLVNKMEGFAIQGIKCLLYTLKIILLIYWLSIQVL